MTALGFVDKVDGRASGLDYALGFKTLSQIWSPSPCAPNCSRGTSALQPHRKLMLRHIVLSRRAHFWIEIIQGKQVSFTGP